MAATRAHDQVEKIHLAQLADYASLIFTNLGHVGLLVNNLNCNTFQQVKVLQNERRLNSLIAVKLMFSFRLKTGLVFEKLHGYCLVV